jgi:hypothetical protein
MFGLQNVCCVAKTWFFRNTRKWIVNEATKYRIIFKQFTCSQLIKKFPPFHNRKVHYCFLWNHSPLFPEPGELGSQFDILFIWIHFNIIILSLT